MWLVVFVFWHDRQVSEIYSNWRPDDCTFFSGRNLIDKGKNPPKNIAHNFHFSNMRYGDTQEHRIVLEAAQNTKHNTHRKKQPTRWAMPPCPPAALPPISPWVEQWHHQIMVPPLPNTMRRPGAIGVALAVVGLLAWGGKIRGIE